MVKRLFVCETCGTRHGTLALATSCEAQGYAAKFKVGEIVVVHEAYGWHDGDEYWLKWHGDKNSRGHSTADGRPCRDFLFVVVEIMPAKPGVTRADHEVLYRLATRGRIRNTIPLYKPTGWGLVQRVESEISAAEDPPFKVIEEAAALVKRLPTIKLDRAAA